MAPKHKARVIYCAARQREVQVTYTVSGDQFAREYDVVSCPAMFDGGAGCDRRCKALLGSHTEPGLSRYTLSG